MFPLISHGDVPVGAGRAGRAGGRELSDEALAAARLAVEGPRHAGDALHDCLDVLLGPRQAAHTEDTHNYQDPQQHLQQSVEVLGQHVINIPLLLSVWRTVLV